VNKLAFLLSVVVLFLATIPCCLADNCSDKEALTEQSSQQNTGSDSEDCDACSPFFQCHSCNGFAFTNQVPKLVKHFFLVIKRYAVFSQHIHSVFVSTIWQPPKMA